MDIKFFFTKPLIENASVAFIVNRFINLINATNQFEGNRIYIRQHMREYRILLSKYEQIVANHELKSTDKLYIEYIGQLVNESNLVPYINETKIPETIDSIVKMRLAIIQACYLFIFYL
jgi:hypothetical protein